MTTFSDSESFSEYDCRQLLIDEQRQRCKDSWVRRFITRNEVHDWRYFRMSNAFIEKFPYDLAISRCCDKCGYMQCTNDGKTWVDRM